MGWIVFLVAIGFGGLLLWQNLQAITLIFFGGVMTVTLPIAVWVFLFLLAGIIGSLTLQFLYGFGRAPARPLPADPIPARPSPAAKPPRQPYVREKEPEEVRSPVPPVTNDWERDSNGDDWNLEVPPEQPTRIQEPEIIDRPIADGVNTVSEGSSPPAKTPSVYSYSYRTAQQTRGEKADTVYDANYRIITPPAGEETDRPAKTEEEEDWI